MEVNGKPYRVKVSPAGVVERVSPAAPVQAVVPDAANPVSSPLAGTVVEVKVAQGQSVSAGEVVLILEAMKMETEIRTPRAGVVTEVKVKRGEGVSVGQTLLTLA